MGMQDSRLQVAKTSATASLGYLASWGLLDKLPLAFGAGLLLGLSTPGFDVWWLAWIGIAPLLVLIQSSRSKLEAFVVGLSFGTGYYLLALRWYLGLHQLSWLGVEDWLSLEIAAFVWLAASSICSFAVAGFSLFLFALPVRAGSLPSYKRPFFPYLLTVPVLWVFFQWLIGACEFGFVPISQLAYSQTKELALIQMCKLGGPQMVESVLLLVNAVFASCFLEVMGFAPKLTNRVDRLSAKAGVLFDLTLVLTLVFVAIYLGEVEINRLASLTALPPKGVSGILTPPVPVAVIQGNLSIEDERLHTLSQVETEGRYIGLVHNLGVAVVALPEGVINGVAGSTKEFRQKFMRLASFEAKELIVGTIEPVGDRFADAVYLLSPLSNGQSFYIGRQFDPFGEFQPMFSLFQKSQKELLHGDVKYLSSKSLSLLDSVWGKIGASICTEVANPKLIADEVRHGASLLVNVSNLAWFHDSALNQQILAASVMRAVENGRYLLLASNTGISAIIDPSGCVVASSLPSKKGVLLGTIQFLYEKTPFTRMWWL